MSVGCGRLVGGRQSSYSEVVGEFQFAFVLFHIGQSYEVRVEDACSLEFSPVEEYSFSADGVLFDGNERGHFGGCILSLGHEDAATAVVGAGRRLLLAVAGRGRGDARGGAGRWRQATREQDELCNQVFGGWNCISSFPVVL